MYADSRHRPMPLEAVTLLDEGRVIDAVKVVREAEGLGLREAKARVDAHIASEPLLRARYEMLRSESRRRFFLWFLVIDLLIVAGVIYWLRFRGAF